MLHPSYYCVNALLYEGKGCWWFRMHGGRERGPYGTIAQAWKEALKCQGYLPPS